MTGTDISREHPYYVASKAMLRKYRDLYVGGEPVETNDSNRALQIQTPVYQWLVRNAERFGFQPYYYEPWHWEYTGTHQ